MRRGQATRAWFLPLVRVVVLVILVGGIPAAPRPARGEVPSPDPAKSPDLTELARSPRWLRLLHVRPGLLPGRGARSTVDEPTFFLSPEGKVDPRAELEATIAAFRDPVRRVTRLAQPARCAFPERFRWISGATGESFPAAECREFDDWRRGLGAASVTLVYSSAYPNNPASMFGHTLLRLNRPRANDSRRLELLDYGVNYSAMGPPDEGGLLHALKGLLGLYPGEYSLAPYYQKVNEYVTSESRDLWEYDLAIEGDALESLVSHLWELYVSGSAAYWFIDENCSHEMLALLEVARPDWTLLNALKVFTLPADTLKAVVAQPGAVLSVRHRPSARRKMLAARRALVEAERELYENVVRGRVPVTEVNARPTLDAIIAWLDYAKHRANSRSTPENQARLRQALVHRASLGTPPSSEEVPRPAEEAPTPAPTGDRPDRGHASSTWEIGALAQPGLPVGLTLGLRPALHDLTDPAPGYEPGSRIAVLDARVSLRADPPRARLEQLTLVDVTSLHAFDPLEPQQSWSIRAELTRLRDLPAAESPLAAAASFGVGLTLASPTSRWSAYGMAQFELQYASAFARRARFQPGLLAGVLVREGAGAATHLVAAAFLEAGGPEGRVHHERLALTQSAALNASWQLRLELAQEFRRIPGADDPLDALLALRRYF